MKYLLLPILVFFFFAAARAQSGVLIPGSKDKPDEKILSLEKMSVSVCVDNQTAFVKVVQIYKNHTAQIQEGKYVFALPDGAAVSDFAVWDGMTRIPGVMLEKRRANQIYEAIKRQTIDPGILQIDEETGGQTAFSAKVFPIPADGTKRLEIEYTQPLRLENFSSRLTFPFKPSFGEPQTVGEFSLDICAYSESPMTAIRYDAENFPLRISKNTENEFAGSMRAENYRLNQDFSLEYQIGVAGSFLSFIAYRAPETISAFEIRNPALARQNADGYFELRAVFNEPFARNEERPPRKIILLLDTSLSMYGEKLRKAFEAADLILHELNERDEFNLVLFGGQTQIFSDQPVPASAETVERALEFLKNSHLGGGTNLKKALEKSIELAGNFSPGEKSIILISDSNSTLGTADSKKISGVFDKRDDLVKLYALGLGSDADNTLIGELAKKTNGFYLLSRETEEIAPLVSVLLSKIGSRTIENLKFSSDAAENFYGVYATGERSYNGSSFSFVGRYKEPRQTVLNFEGQMGADSINLWKTVELPAFADLHSHLPRVWAEARIHALVREINLYGEREDFISEIIALSQKYKIVSPYTAFIAAPRALLRPRLIQPGDPVIRVKTDESIREVFAVLPFGETLQLEFLESEKVWETRFLAPVWMTDGVYTCRLLLTDREGNGFEETKTFVVDSSAPKLKINLSKAFFREGEEIEIRVSADRDTARLTARFYGAKPVQLFWSNAEKASLGKIRVPDNIASGRYVLTVAAEDFARNQTSEEAEIEIIGN